MCTINDNVVKDHCPKFIVKINYRMKYFGINVVNKNIICVVW